jgi:hypothetical protein
MAASASAVQVLPQRKDRPGKVGSRMAGIKIIRDIAAGQITNRSNPATRNVMLTNLLLAARKFTYQKRSSRQVANIRLAVGYINGIRGDVEKV